MLMDLPNVSNDYSTDGADSHFPQFFSNKSPSLLSIVCPRLFVLYFVILLISYSNSFHASWQLDDKPNILNNPRIQISELSLNQLWQSMNALPGSGGFYRPVACVTLALNWFFGQRAVFGYHVINFAIHFLTACFLFITIATLFSTPRLMGRYDTHQTLFIAALAALFWALNPMQTQAVTYVVQRMTSLAGMFAVLAILFYLRARLDRSQSHRIVYFMSFRDLFPVGIVFSKENVILLPLCIPVLEGLFFYNRNKTLPIRKTLILIGIIIGLCLIVTYLIKPDLTDFVLTYYENRTFTFAERILSEPRIVAFYLSQLFFPAPSRLSIEHDISTSSNLLSPWTTLPAILFHVALLYIAFRLWRKKPLITLAILFFYLNHMVESTIIPLELIFEHRNYLPSIFLFLPVALAINALMVRLNHRNGLVLLVVIPVAFMLMLEGYATYQRNKTWQTEKTLWLDALEKAPRSARPVATLALMLAWGEYPSTFKYRKALEMTKMSLSLRMNRNYEADQLGNIASIYDKLGQNEKAWEYYDAALTLNPNHTQNRFNLAKSLVRQGKFNQAADALNVILNQGWIHADYFGLLGFIQLWLDQPDQALTHLQRALSLAPGRPDILLSMGNCMTALGFYDRAQWFLGLAQRKGGHDLSVSLSLLQNALKKNDRHMAQQTLLTTLELYPLPLIQRELEISTDRYEKVPVDHNLLREFILSELQR